MRTNLFLLFALYLLSLFSTPLFSQVKIGVKSDLTTPPDPSAVMEVVSLNKGFLPPRLTMAQRDAIVAPARGLTIYNSSEKCINVFDSNGWETYCELRFSTTCNCVEYLNDYGLPTEAWIPIAPDANNGLNLDAAQNKIQLGGPLVESTTVTQGAHKMEYNLDGTGDFDITVNSNPLFHASNLGRIGINTNTPKQLLHIHCDSDNLNDSTFQVLQDGRVAIGREIYEGLVNISTSTTSPGTGNFEAMNRAQIVFRDMNGDRSYITGFDTGLLIGGNWVDFNLAAAAGTEPQADFYLSGTGRVGLGTFRPLARLHVASTTNGVVLQDTNAGLNGTSHNNGIRLQDSVNALTGFLGFSTGVELLTIQNRNDDGGISFYTGGLFERMRITSTGNVGIGLALPAHPLHLAGGAHVTTAGVWTNASDARLKTNIQNMEYGLDEVMNLRAVHYDMKKDGTPQIGFLAQEVQAIIPEVVSGKEGDIAKGETLGLSYGQLVPVLTKAIQEQQKTIAKLQADLEAQNKATLDLFNTLQAEISALKQEKKSVDNLNVNR